ncbi:MAG: 3'(2'),5'-bisphosphate nucleotidase [Gammaproteobacteria bacterium]|nr:3'(2'),5'-bisphosphate nucleotidase [Gammaproteobacteria bacterium]
MKDIDEVTRHLPAILDAVAEACRVTRHVQGEPGRIEKHSKDDHSPVTIADYAAQAVVAHRLAALSAPMLMVGEEDAATLREPASAALRAAVTAAARVAWPEAGDDAVLDAIDRGNHDASAAAYWTLDPIDGTKGFLRGGQYAVSLALIVEGEVVFGVLGCPNLSADFGRAFDARDDHGSLLYALRGHGAFSVPADAPATRPSAVHTSAEPDVTRMRVCESVEAAHSRLDDTARIVAHLGATGTPARLDSQCKYAVVARGQADAYLRLPTRRDYVEKIWDHAAGKLVAEEAGAVVSDIHGHALDFGHGAGLSANRGVICATPACHDAILRAIEDLRLFAD